MDAASINLNQAYDKTFILEARWLISNDKTNAKVLQDTAIVVENQLIIDILPINVAREKYPQFSTKVLNQHAVLPGLINAHTHSPMNLLKGYADDLPLQTWLNDHIRPAEDKFFSEEFAYDGAYLAICEMLLNGITCFNDMYFYSACIAKAASELGIRAAIGTHVFDKSSPWADTPADYLNHCEIIIEKYQGHPLITPVVCPHAPYTVSNATFKQIINFAERKNIIIGCHIHETLWEINESLKQYKVRPIARLHNLGLLNCNLHAIHVVHLNDAEISLFAKKNIAVVHCPESNLKLGSGFCRVADLLAANINVALGTDGAASNNDLDILGEMRTTTLIAKGITGDPSVLPAARALHMATINGAKLLNLDDKIGSLTIGKEADIIAVDLSAVGSAPVYDPISSIIYTATKQQVSDVWINGVHRVSDHKLLGVDPNKIQNIITKWLNRISKNHDSKLSHR